MSKIRYSSICIITEEPDYMKLPDHTYDLTYYAYGNVREHLPTYAHEPLGNCITLSHYVDANLMNIRML